MVGMALALTLATFLHAISQDNIKKELDDYLAAAEKSGFSGAVLVVKDGETIINNGYGSANREKSLPNTARTVFDIGSISKQFTKAAILALEEDHELSTNDTVSRFFPQAPKDKAVITIQQLMEHRSGLGEYHDTEGDFEPLTREEALTRILAQKLRFTPGDKEAYSNSGYTLLAIIVEEASGLPFRSFLRRRLLEPACMERTGFYREALWKEEDVAVGYGGRKIGPVNSPQHWPEITWALLGNGGMVSSTGDLYRWIQALNDGKILSKGSLEKLYRGAPPSTRPGTSSRPYIAYAGGNDFGFVAVVFELFGEDSFIIAASNTAGRHSAERVGRQLARLLLGEEPLTHEQKKKTRKDWGLPDSKTGRRAAALLDAIHAGTDEAAHRFVIDNLAPEFLKQIPEEEHVAILRELQSMLPDVALLGARKEGPVNARLTLGSLKLGHEVEVSYELEPDPPHRIRSMEIGEVNK